MKTKFFQFRIIITIALAHLLFSNHIPLDAALDKTIEMSWPVACATSSFDGNVMFLGAASIGAENGALTIIDIKSGARGITPEKTLLDYQPDQTNPLHNSAINHLELLVNNNNPIVVTKSEPNSAYCILDYTPGRSSIVACKEIKNELSKPCDSVQAIATGNRVYTFAALESIDENNQDEKALSLGILKLSTRTLENKSVQYFLEQIDLSKLRETKPVEDNSDEAVKKRSVESQATEQEPKILALPIRKDSPFLAIQQPVKKLEKITALHWHENLNVVYLAFELETGADDQAGGYGVAVGRVSASGGFEITSICPSTILKQNSTDQIIAAKKPNTKVVINDLKDMTTSTGLDYLVVATGDTCSDAKNVYALPLYGVKSDLKHVGQLAKKDGAIIATRINRNFHYTGPKLFGELATQEDDIYTKHDAAALVGAGPLPGAIKHLQVSQDAIFVTIDSNEQNMPGGIFTSQAIFGVNGTIKAWTAWQRIASSNQSCFYFNPIRPQGAFLWLTGNETESCTIRRSDWQNREEINENTLTKTVTELFNDRGGISQLICVPHTNTAVKNQSILIALGNKKIALAQTGFIENSLLVPCEDNARYALKQGLASLADTQQTDTPLIISFDEADLPEIGTLTYAQIVADTSKKATQGWLFVAGTHGLSLLCHDNGSGWPVDAEGMNKSLANLAGMKFKKLGNYNKIVKLVADKEYLYILTDTKLDRIALNQDDYAHNNVSAVTVASAKDFKGCTKFFDVLISEKLALLATNLGIFRVSNNKDIATIENQADQSWSLLYLPEQILPIIKLTAFTETLLENDVSRLSGGMVLSLGSYRGKNKAHLHRLSIAPTDNDQAINDFTVTLLPEMIAWGEKLSLNAFHTHKNLFITDGAFYYSYPGKENDTRNLMCGLRFNEAAPLLLQENDEIACMVREYASGHWMLAGTFGLLIHD